MMLPSQVRGQAPGAGRAGRAGRQFTNAPRITPAEDGQNPLDSDPYGLPRWVRQRILLPAGLCRAKKF
jgi:hypothetical protein